MQDLLVCACAVQCIDGTFCNRFVTRTPVITHIYIHLIFVCLSVCTSCIPAINLGHLQEYRSPTEGGRGGQFLR